MKAPSAVIRAATTGEIRSPVIPPAKIVRRGTRIISAFVFPVMAFPQIAPARAAIHAPRGSPDAIAIAPVSAIVIAPPPIVPAVAAAKRARPFAPMLYATPIPIAGHVRHCAIWPKSESHFRPEYVPICLMI